ncbi:hypothetical protein GOV09_00145 [Candidatus Woesearchaeota archaeon]|nr:hypothetical protein [Candidatus Woesearchaeota archaeon]
MKRMFWLGCFLIAMSMVAADLGDFPDNLFLGSRFNGYIVVGAQGSSTDVISQNMLGLKIAAELGAPLLNVYQLDSDVDLSTNLILIGNPCVNDLTAELLGDPSPCDADFPAGKAYVKYIAEDGITYIIAAGHTDQGTRKAVEKLATFSLSGSDVEIDIEGDTVVEREKEEEKPEPTLYEKTPPLPPVDVPKKEPRKEVKAEEFDEPMIVVEEKGLFIKVWDWFTGLFK